MENEIIVNGESLSPEVAEALGGLVGGSLVVLGIIAVILAILQIIANWKIFSKAGKPGWHSIIPLLSTWDEIDLSWNSTMATVGAVLALVGCILGTVMQNSQAQAIMIAAVIVVVALVAIAIVSLFKMAKAFGKGVGFFLGLLFLNPIFMLILGFGSAKYVKNQE